MKRIQLIVSALLTTLFLLSCSKEMPELTTITVTYDPASYYEEDDFEIEKAGIYFAESDAIPFVDFTETKIIKLDQSEKFEVNELAPGNYYFIISDDNWPYKDYIKPFQVIENKETEVSIEVD